MKKGFTLVELIATLVVLSIIALIITPNILVSIREYKKQVYDNNIQAIESAAKDWTADHIESLPNTESKSLLISIEELVNDAYLDEKPKDPLEGGYFDDDDHFTFVIVDCTIIEDEITGELINTKYEYNAYASIDDFIEKAAIRYAKDNNITSDNIQYGVLSGTYIKNTILNTEWYSTEYSENELSTEYFNSQINNISISYSDEEYSAVVNWK